MINISGRTHSYIRCSSSCQSSHSSTRKYWSIRFGEKKAEISGQRGTKRHNFIVNAWSISYHHTFFFKKKFDWSHLKKLFERDAFYFYQSVIYVLSSRPAAHLPFFSKQYPPYLILIWNWKCIIEKKPHRNTSKKNMY